MSYLEKSLSDNETIRAEFKLHWFAWIPVAIWILLALPTFGITLILAIAQVLRIVGLEQGVTNKRVIRKTGIISRKTEEMKIPSIETIEIEQSLLGRLFGFGRVKITGRGISDLRFTNIDNPLEVKKQIESIEPA